MSDFQFLFPAAFSEDAAPRGWDNSYDLLDDYGVYVTAHTGLGMPPVDNIATDYAIVDGAYFQRAITRKRVIQLSCVLADADQPNLHAKRKAVIAAINRDVTRSSAFILRYTGSGDQLDITVRYDGGLEMERAADDPLQPFAIRLVSYDPFWEWGTNTAVCVASSNVVDANGILMRDNTGNWRALGAGFNGRVRVIAEDPATGNIYAGGNFNTAYNGAGMTSAITARGVAVWDGTVWDDLDGGISGSTAAVRAIAFGAAGEVYVGGEFTTAGSAAPVAISNVACFKAGSWQTGTDYFGSGVNGSVRAIVEDPSAYQVWVGGIFSTAYNVGSSEQPGTKFVSTWRSGSWYTVHSGSIDPAGYVYALEARAGVSPLYDEVFVGGAFNSIASLAVADGIAKYMRLGGGGWYAAGGFGPTTGDYQTVRALTNAPDGNLYAGGYFSEADGSTARRVARWNGSQWLSVGNGLGSDTANASEYISRLSVDSENRVYAAGVGVTTAGPLTLIEKVAEYEGGAWYPLSVDLPGSPEVSAVCVDSDDTLYLGFSTFGTAVVPGINNTNYGEPVGLLVALALGGQVTSSGLTNNGTAKAYPVITITRTGGTSATIQSFINWTTGDKIIMSYAMLDGETVTITLTPGEKSAVSSKRGNVLSRVLGQSNLMSWALAPGLNQVSSYVTGDATVSVIYRWPNRTWSADG